MGEGGETAEKLEHAYAPKRDHGLINREVEAYASPTTNGWALINPIFHASITW